MHAVVGELMHANNLYIALYDEERQLINFPYHVDELDDDWPETNEWVEFGNRQARGVTGYALRTGEPATDHAPTAPGTDRAGRDRARGSTHGGQHVARCPAEGRGADGRTPRRAVVHEGRPLRRAGQGAARLRGPARRRGALACAGDRGDAAAQRRARADQQRPGGARRRARAAGDLRRRRRQAPGGVRRTGRRHRGLRPGGRGVPLPVHDRARRPLPGRAARADRLPQARHGDARAAADRRGQHGCYRAVRQSAGGRGRAAAVRALRAPRDRRDGNGRRLAPEPRPGARVHRFRPAAPGDAGPEPQRRARERAARARDAATQRRARADQQRPGGDRRRARPAGDLRPRRRQDPGDLRRAGRRHRHLRRGVRTLALPVRDRARRRATRTRRSS